MIGKTLQKRYRLEAELGRGGMSTVYRAFDTELEREVAVKLMARTALGAVGRRRLLSEAKTIAKLNHPNIVTVYDVGEIDEGPFIVMELVEGRSLYERRPENLDELIAITRQVCTALNHAHAQDIIHRDLKPENVIVQSDGTAKLMDFGLARHGTSRLTQESEIVGTVFYLAPEQALGKEIDARTDLYALGVMLYELATGSLPYEGDDPLAVISQHIHAEIVPPRDLNADLPVELNDLIISLMGKDPADRPQSARNPHAGWALAGHRRGSGRRRWIKEGRGAACLPCCQREGVFARGASRDVVA
jgi:serine/threonine-protein kinase